MSSSKGFGQRLVRASERFRLDSDLLAAMESHGGVKNAAIRAHPCNFHLPALKLPDRLDRAAIEVLKEVDVQPEVLAQRAKRLTNYLWQRPLPLEQVQRRFLLKKFEMKQMPKNMTEEEMDEFYGSMQLDKRTISRHVNKEVADWQPLRYSPTLAPVYLVARLVPNFAITCRALFEVRKRCPDFAPQSLYDFGSGLGTTVWAANSVWPEGSLREHLMVDTAPAMLSLAERLQRDGRVSPHVASCFPGVFSRQFLSASPQPKFDLVVASGAMLDLGMSASRRVALETLWRKTDGFLVLVEQGTNAGFQAILEARDFLLKNFGPEVEEEDEAAHLFAPCPHNMKCPKRDSICNLYVTYKKFNLTSVREDYAKELLSYVIFSKGPRRVGPTNETPLSRIISYKPRKTKFFVLHDICSPSGTSERVSFSKKDSSKPLYAMMSKAVAGDLVPSEMKATPVEADLGKAEEDPESD